MKERQVGSVAIIELTGRLTMGRGSEELYPVLQSVIARGYPNLLLECGQVSGIDSAGIGTLARGLTAAQKRGGKLKLLHLSPQLRKALELVGLLKSNRVIRRRGCCAC